MNVSMMYKLVGAPLANPRSQAWGMQRDDGTVFLTCWVEEVDHKKCRVPVIKPHHAEPRRVGHVRLIKEGAEAFVFLATRNDNGTIKSVQDRLYRVAGIEVDDGVTYATLNGWVTRW